jgi:glycosyltransferase involved in cell wall biosynthesis
MKKVMVIPSYWGEKTTYDHPTLLEEEEGTLGRCLKSINILKEKDFILVIIGIPTSEDVAEKVEEKIAGIIKSARMPVETFLFSSSHLKKIKKILISSQKSEFLELLKLKGYSSIRNLGLVSGEIFGGEIIVFIDDDEVFEDPHFIEKAEEFIGKEEVKAVAGYYLQPDGNYLLKKEVKPYMVYWNNLQKMNETFAKIIGSPPRLKPTPLVFGGNMIIHRDLYRVVPFDPSVPRGEDIDYLINARMFGFQFFLDNQLSIKHLPPPHSSPVWAQIRRDTRRFILERAKIDSQVPHSGMVRVKAEEFDPYPGAFLKGDLEDKIYKANQLLAIDYLREGKKKDCQEALNNILSIQSPEIDPFENLVSLQKRWQEMMSFLSRGEIKSEIRKIW